MSSLGFMGKTTLCLKLGVFIANKHKLIFVQHQGFFLIIQKKIYAFSLFGSENGIGIKDGQKKRIINLQCSYNIAIICSPINQKQLHGSNSNLNKS